MNDASTKAGGFSPVFVLCIVSIASKACVFSFGNMLHNIELKSLSISHKVNKVNMFNTITLLQNRVSSNYIFWIIVFNCFKRSVLTVFRFL